MDESFTLTDLMSLKLSWNSKSERDFRQRLRTKSNCDEVYNAVTKQFSERARTKGYSYIDREMLSKNRNRVLKRDFEKLIATDRNKSVQNLLIPVEHQPMAKRLARRSGDSSSPEKDSCYEKSFEQSLEMSK